MAWRKGFLRLWLLVSLIWLGLWLLANQTIEKSYEFASSSYLSTSFSREDLTLDKFVAGVAEFSIRDVSNAWLGHRFWMDSPRVLEVETSGVTPESADEWNRLVDAAAKKFNQDGAIHNAHLRLKRNAVVTEAIIGLVVPALLFVMGAGVAWALLGFRK